MDYTNSPHTADFRNRHKRQTIRSTPAGFRRISQLKPGSKARRNTVIRTIIMALVLAFGLSQAAFADTAKVNINTATAEQLAEVLSGIGQAKAEAIVEYRNQNGARSEERRVGKERRC